MIILFGSIPQGRATTESDIDILIDQATALGMPEDCWTLAGSCVDGHYVETHDLGWPWANCVSNPEVDDPLKPTEHQIWFDPGMLGGARIITKEELIEMIKELNAGEIPEVRGKVWAPKNRGGTDTRNERDLEMLELSEEGFTQREIAAQYGLNQANISRALRRAQNMRKTY